MVCRVPNEISNVENFAKMLGTLPLFAISAASSMALVRKDLGMMSHHLKDSISNSTVSHCDIALGHTGIDFGKTVT